MKRFFSKLTSAVLCIGLTFTTASALELSKPDYEPMHPKIVSDTLTQYAPWLSNFHLRTEERKAAGKRGGMSAQRIICYDVSPIDTNFHVAGVDTNGIIYSSDGGNNWSFSSVGIKARTAKDVAFDPYHDGVVYTILMTSLGGTYDDALKSKEYGGIFVSHDNGFSWEQKNDGILLQGTDVSDDMICFDKKGNAYVFLNDGVLKSSDQGETWTNLGAVVSTSATAEGLWVSDDGKTILSANSQSGIVGTVDGGRKWKTYGPFVDGALIKLASFAVDPDDSSHWYATDSGNYAGQLFETIDFGKTWTNLGKIFTGWNSRFSNITFGARNSAGIRRMFISGFNTARGFRYSDDGGKTWDEVPFSKVDPFARGSYTSGAFAVNPLDDKKIYYASDDSILSSDDNGDTWHEHTGGYSGHTARNYTFDKDGYLYAAMHDFAFFQTNQPFEADDNGDYPITVTMHDEAYGGNKTMPRWSGAQTCGDVDVDPRDSNRILASVGKYGDMIITESRDGGKTWKHIEATVPLKRSRVPEVNFHDDDPDTIYTSFFISRDNGVTWEATPCMISDVCKSNNDYVVGYGDGKVWMSKDRGITWTTVDEPLSPWGMIYDIEDPDTVWISCQSGNIVKISDGEMIVLGEENGLGDQRLYQIAQNPFNPAHLLACGTPVASISGYGVFESYDYGESWHIVAGTDLGSADWYSVIFNPNERTAVLGSYMGTFIYDYDKYRDYLEKNGDEISMIDSYADGKMQDGSDCVLGNLNGVKNSLHPDELYMEFNRRNEEKYTRAVLVVNVKVCAGGILSVYSYSGTGTNTDDIKLIAEERVIYNTDKQKISVDITDYYRGVTESGANPKLMIKYDVTNNRYQSNGKLMNVVCAGKGGAYSPYIKLQ